MPEISTAPAAGEVQSVQTPATSGVAEQAHSSSQRPEPSSHAQNGQNGRQAPGDSSTPEAGDHKAERKRESHYERIKRKKAEFQQREAQLKQREAAIAQAERERSQPQKPKRDYTLADLKQYRRAWAEEAQFDSAKAELVKQADAEIKAMEAEEQQAHGQEAHAREWHQAEAELFQADQEFMRPGTRLDSKLREIMQGADGQIYRGHPRGIVAAYHRAKMEILEGDYRVAQGKIQQLETELKRLTGLTSIGGGAPGRVGGARIESLADFSKLSSADMRKHLKSGSGKGGMPWL